MSDVERLVRSVLAGAATGCRTFTGLAALTLTADEDATTQPDRTLARPAVQATVALLAAAELAADKLPTAPSRFEAPGLVGRIVSGAACGVIVALRSPPATAPQAPGEPGTPRDVPHSSRVGARVGMCVAASTAAVFGASWLGVRWRAWAGGGTVRAMLAAMAEDAVAGSLAATAARA